MTATAATVNFDFTAGYTNQQTNVTVENGGVTIVFDKGKGNSAPTWLSSSNNMRVYWGNTVTVSAEATITSITFTFEGSDRNFKNGTSTQPTVSTGSYTEDGATGTWSGEAATVTLTAGGSKGHARINAMTVTVEGEMADVVPNPVISPAATLFSPSIEVSIACDDEDASIYYTLDDTEPSAASNLYTEPFTLTQTATVKAIAVKGMAKSSVVTSTFTRAAGVQSIAEFLTLDEGETVVFENPVVVTHYTDKHLYVQDETGAMLIWGETGQTYTKGDIIPAGFYGTSAIYGGEPELSVFRTYNFKPATEQVEVTPLEIAASEIDTYNFARYVVVKGVVISTMGDDYYWITDLFNEQDYGMLYTANFGILPPDDLDQAYDVTGIVGSHYNIGTIYYLQPIEFKPTELHPALQGDVNYDGLVNGGDITALYEFILNDTPVKGDGDVNGDGNINGADVTLLYNILLGIEEE